MKVDDDDYTNDGTVDIHNNKAKRRKTGTWKASRFIIGNNCAERLAYYGIKTNLVNYLGHFLNQSNVAASNNLTNWLGTGYITPIIGAFLADAYFGRYWTIAGLSIVSIFGMILVTLSASMTGLKPSCNGDTCQPTVVQSAVVFVALYMIALGNGGMKPCISSFGADQFDETDENERKKKSSFFNWQFLSMNIGILMASSVLVWVQTNVDWGWGFGIPAATMVIASVLFFSGSHIYRFKKLKGNPFTRSLQVIVSSCRKFNVKVSVDTSLLYETIDEESSTGESRKLNHTNDLKFLDKAAVVTQADDYVKGLVNPWRLCSVTQIEELKSILRLLPLILTSGIVFSTIFTQMNTMFVLQGNTMNPNIGPKFKIPSASLVLFNSLACVFWTPIYDMIIVPYMRKFTGNERGFTQLQRMGIGLVISTIAMVTAATVEMVRLKIVKNNNYYDVEHIPMSIVWQIPQYLLIGVSEVFTLVGQVEFFYDQAPDSMRSMCSALSKATFAYLSTLLVTFVEKHTTRNQKLGWIPDNLNRGHLDYFFWLLVIISLGNFGVYLFLAMRFKYK
ncbi:hypothetical protein REPUB_Repub06bG0210300 [Reevesia pubescens]